MEKKLPQPTQDSEEEKKLKQQLEEEKLKNEIHKLKASTVEIWVKEIKSIVLLAIFVLGTVVNAITYVLNLVAEKTLRAVSPSPAPLPDRMAGMGGGGGETEGAEIAMAMAQEGFDIIELLKGMAGSHTLWQIVLFAVLIPIAMDWYKKRKKEEARDASTKSNTDEDKH